MQLGIRRISLRCQCESFAKQMLSQLGAQEINLGKARTACKGEEAVLGGEGSLRPQIRSDAIALPM